MPELSNEQQFAIFRKCPHLIVDNQLQLVDVVTDLFQHRSYCIVISNGFFALIFYLVSHVTFLTPIYKSIVNFPPIAYNKSQKIFRKIPSDQ